VTFAELRTDVVILACAISAGIHGALAPGHFDEATGAGLGFVVAIVLLAVLAAALTWEPRQTVLLAAVLVLAGLVVSYVLAVTTGVPVLHPEQESVDGLALFTKAVEVAGLVVAVGLLRGASEGRRASAPVPIALTALVACFSATAALAVSAGMDMGHAHRPSHHGHVSGHTDHAARTSDAARP
jgi:hypothetical protein